MSGAHDCQGRRIKSGQTVQFQWSPAQVEQYAPGWYHPGIPGLCGRAIVRRVLSDRLIRLDFRQNMPIGGADEGPEVECPPDTLWVVDLPKRRR